MLLFYKKHYFYWLLMIFSLSVGVGVVVSVDSTIYSIFKALEIQDDYLMGKATHSMISPTQNIPETFYQSLKLNSGEIIATPWISGKIKWQNQDWNLIGIEPIQEIKLRNHWFNSKSDFQIIDFFKKPNATVIIQQNPSQLESNEIQILGVTNKHTLHVIDVIQKPSIQELDQTLLVDIGTAQTILNQEKTIQRIDLILKNQKEFQRVSQWLKTYPSDISLQEVQQNFQESQTLISAFKMNLQALSLIVVIVGCFVILNTMYFLILKRKEVLEIYYTLGMTKAEILRSLLGEALLLGIIGSGLGTVLGRVFSHFLITQVTQNINDHFFEVSVNQIYFHQFDFIKAYLIGISASLVATLLPAWDINKKITGQTFSQQTKHTTLPQSSFKIVIYGLLFFLLGFYLASHTSIALQWNIVGFFLQFLGILCFFPTLSHSIFLVAQKYSQKSFWLKCLFATLLYSSTRIRILCIAVILALATMIAVETMTSSFRKTFVEVMNQTVQGDFYVFHRLSQKTFILPNWLVDFQNNEKVKTITTYFLTQTTYQEKNYPLYVYDVLRGDDFQGQILKNPPLQLKNNNLPQVKVSEVLQNRLQMMQGDVISLATDQGTVNFFVANIFYDYAYPQGLISIDAKTYHQYWQGNPQEVNGFALEWQDNTQQNPLANQFIKKLDNMETLEWKNHQMIKQAALKIFDRTFAITAVLKTIVVIVALIGMLSTYFLLQFENLSTFGLFRVMGVSSQQVTGFMILESLILGGMLGFLSWLPGIWLSWILVDFINVKAFGWSFQWQIDMGILWQALFLNLIATLCAVSIPSWYVSQKMPIHLVHHE